MAILALLTATHTRTDIMARHRAQTDQAIARIRDDASLDDRERARRITQIIADANWRVVAIASRRAS
jgi:hypothetical protein